MSRFRTRTVVVAAGLSATALVGGVVAVLSDTFTFDGNVVDSEAGRAPRIEVAEIADSATPCPTADRAWSPGPFEGTFSADDDLEFDVNSIWTGRARSFCIRNQGSLRGSLTFSTEALESSEVGDCTPYEIEAGDTDCRSGDPGELLELIDLRLDQVSGATGCQNSSFFPGTTIEASGQVLTSGFGILPDGGACKLIVTPRARAATFAELRQSESDRAAFALVLTLTDSP